MTPLDTEAASRDIPGAGPPSPGHRWISTLKSMPFFQATIDQMQSGLLITRLPENEIVFINSTACKLFGIEDIRNRRRINFWDFFFKAGGECLHVSKDIHCQDAFSRPDACEAKGFEVRIRQPKGEQTYIGVSTSFARDTEQHPVASIAVLEDINKKTENNIKIRQKLQQLEYALSASVDGLWEWNIAEDEGYLSPRYREIYGYAGGEVPEDIKFWHAMLHPDDRSAALSRLVAAIKSPRDTYTSTYRMKNRQGTYRWILSKAIVTERGADGKATKMVGTHQDISRRVALETRLKNANQHLKKEVRTQTKHLKETNQQLETILNSSSESIWVCDGKGTILKANRAARETIGMDTDQFIGKNMNSLVEKGLIDRSVTMEVLEIKKQATRMQKVLNTEKELLVTGTPVLDESGGVSMVVVNETDLTTLNELKRKIQNVQTASKRFQEELNEMSMLELREQNIIASSKEMTLVITMAMKLAKMDVSNILILGPSGTGKSLMAKFIHNSGPRKDTPFLQINCAALPETLLEAELFGYEQGAFSGARSKGKIGLFELAGNGTIFLDEIGELSPKVQAKILKCIEDKELMHLGGLKVINIECNIIAATNVNLVRKVQEKKFREDLFYRLNIFTLNIPTLKDRYEDIVELSLLFLKRYNKKYGQKKVFSPGCLNRIQQYDFPGNIRELENRIQKAVVVTDGDTIKDLVHFDGGQRPATVTPLAAPLPAALTDGGLTAMLETYEKSLLTEALKQYPSTRQLAAFLKTSQSTIVRRFRKYGLTHLLKQRANGPE